MKCPHCGKSIDAALRNAASKGGKSRLKTMTPAQRSEAARKAARSRWKDKQNPSGPCADAQGEHGTTDQVAGGSTTQRIMRDTADRVSRWPKWKQGEESTRIKP